MLLTLFYGALTILFLGMTGTILFHLHWSRRLPAASSSSVSAPAKCSVVIAARDEEDRIEATLRHLLAQEGVELEIIVVNDRSKDQTGAILSRLAAEDSRVRAVTVETLPSGWLGKCHACHLGSQAATGEWILFTDADCWMKPDVMQRALEAAARENADHVTLTPGVKPESIPAEAWHIAFLLGFTDWISGVNRDRPKKFIGIGAFNFVRANAYRACGGYEALRLTVLDDVKLGLLLRRAGFRTRAFIGGDDVECHWGTTLRAVIKIMEKNYFAAVDYRLAPAVAAGVGGPLVWVAAALGIFTGNFAGATATAAGLLLIIPSVIIARRLRWPMRGAICAPFAFMAIFYAIANSTWVTLRQGGIRWRDTFYPLSELRRGNVQ